MVQIKPFKGIRYNREVVGDFSLVITPPYDVITESERKEFLSKSKFNLLNIILRNEKGNEKYQKAARVFKEWLEGNILITEKEESIYIYSQEFDFNNRRIERTSFIALLKLEPSIKKIILPHEKTLYLPKLDRLKLIRATRAQFGNILVFYVDNRKRISALIKKEKRRTTIIDFRDPIGIRHKVWKIDDKNKITLIVNEMRDKRVYIADGHHRYEAALAFGHETPHLKNSRYVMTSFVDKDDNLLILPIHRLIFNIGEIDSKAVMNSIGRYFDIKEKGNSSRMLRELKGKEHTFGMYYSGSFYILTLKNKEEVEELIDDLPKISRKLDVSILQKLILEKILGITGEDIKRGRKLKYAKSDREALRAIANKECDFAFFLNPTDINQIIEVADHGETMPQKSTLFYPKVYSGVIINKIGVM